MIIESSQTSVHWGFLWILVSHSCPKTSNQMIVHADFCLTNQILLPTPLIWPANLLSAISCYKFHISIDQQENMKFTIICHLAAFFCHWLFINKKAAKWQIIVNFMFSYWSFEIWNLYQDMAESKLAGQIKPCKQ